MFIYLTNCTFFLIGTQKPKLHLWPWPIAPALWDPEAGGEKFKA